MTPYYERFGITVHAGDCLAELAELDDASVHAVCTDPPYELAFMGRQWDASGIAFNPGVWRECLRVLKPGGHLLAFGGSRTWHRLAAAVEDAGFEVRDSIAWLYASGFPKSLDVSKAIDKVRDDRADIIRVTAFVRAARQAAGLTYDQVDAAFGTNGMAWRWSTAKASPVVPTWDQWLKLKELLGFGDEMDGEVRRLNGRKGTPGNGRPDRVVGPKGGHIYGEGRTLHHRGTPVLDVAGEWQGWGTTLKPAHEPVVCARKPLAGTVASNVLEYGTGALNIDECRVPGTWSGGGRQSQDITGGNFGGGTGGGRTPLISREHDAGRWPSNVVLTHACTPDGADLCADGCVPGCPVRELDEQAGIRRSGTGSDERGRRPRGMGEVGERVGDPMPNGPTYADSGGASRFFPVFRFEAKAPAAERPRVDGVAHPTVKPLALMRWLVRLVTPPGGVVLDPFLGSGTTAQAARAEGYQCIGIERDETYLPLIRARLDGDGDDLFGGAA